MRQVLMSHLLLISPSPLPLNMFTLPFPSTCLSTPLHFPSTCLPTLLPFKFPSTCLSLLLSPSHQHPPGLCLHACSQNVTESQPQLAPELLTVSTDTRNSAIQSIVAVEGDSTIWCAAGSAITIVDAA